MSEYIERYEIKGTEENVAEWWKLADKAAQECGCQLSEDFGGSDIGDIVRAMHVLERLTKFANFEGENPSVNVSEGIFLAVPGKEQVIDKEGEFFTWKSHRKCYRGVEFRFDDDFKYKEESKEAVA